MTNKEVINFLDQVRKILLDDKSWLESTIQPVNEAFDMAISALQAQEKCEDAVHKIASASFTGNDGLDYVETLVALNALKMVKKPCGDAVSRQKLLDEYSRLKENWNNADNAVDKCISVLKDLPSVEPKHKTGKWINANDGKWNTVEVLKCSVCGEMDNRMYRTDNYCPNCGAKMDGNE